jgi:thiamine biosynthesis lipoprotein
MLSRRNFLAFEFGGGRALRPFDRLRAVPSAVEGRHAQGTPSPSRGEGRRPDGGPQAPRGEGPNGLRDGDDAWVRVYRTAMACRFEVTLFSEDAAEVEAARAALDEADRLEAALTVFRETSELSRVNRRAADEDVEVDERLFALLRRCRDLHDRTEGAFDITSTPLSRCWGFLLRDGRVPAASEIANARAAVGMSRVRLDEARRAVRFERRGVELNLGAIGKGYALDRMGSLLRARGVRHALLSAGRSSIAAIGGRDGGWTIDLRPRLTRRVVARLRLRDGAVGTSGAGEQYFEVDGARYGHVIDPRSGWPASGVLGASVIVRDAALADALSTAFLVGGPDLARRYSAAHPDTLAVLVFEDGEVERTQVFGSYTGAVLEMAS